MTQAGDVFTLQIADLSAAIKAASTWIDGEEALIFIRYEEGRLYFKRPFDPTEHWVVGHFAVVTLQQKRASDG